MFWILHGEDEFRRSEFLAKLKKGLGDPAEVEINTTLLDGRRVTLSEIIHSCGAIPFLGTSRLVVVDGLLTHLGRARKPSKTNEKGDSSEATSAAAKSLLQNLKEYLRFRHLFRHIYGFKLRWERFKELCVELEGIFKELDFEIKQFMKGLGRNV